MGRGRRPVLLYGFPDPGEAVGGTGIVALLTALVSADPFLASFDVCWHFIPCLNLDDQPDGGRTVRPVMRQATARDVDWCLHDPRAETTALVGYAREVRPAFSLPLHDEYHCGKALDAYFVVSGQCSTVTARRVREYVRAFNVPLDRGKVHPRLGEGFLAFGPATEGYEVSTFSILAQTGPVFIGEVSKWPELSAPEIVALQMGVGLIAMAGHLQHSGRGAAPPGLFGGQCDC
jgi:hypothetical protein